MIFNTWAYYLFFLVPSAILFRLSPPRYRPWVIVAGGSGFFLYFSYTELGGIIPAACLGIFLWESITSRFLPAEIVVLLGGSCAGNLAAFYI